MMTKEISITPVISNNHPHEFDPPKLLTVSPLLLAQGLTKCYSRIVALANVNVTVYPGEVLGIVGESGSGKSTLLRILNLEEAPDEGKYWWNIHGYEDIDLFELDHYRQREARIQHIGIVYQHPHQGLRMHYTSSGNVAERLILSGERYFAAMRTKAQDALDASEFPLQRMDDFPYRLSGGMQQRVQLAKALALRPQILLLDEPTSGLDVSVQATVLDTLKRLQRELHITMILVSHDLGVIRTLADRVMVMRQGHVIETGLTDQVLEDPQESYTQQLVHAKL